MIKATLCRQYRNKTFATKFTDTDRFTQYIDREYKSFRAYFVEVKMYRSKLKRRQKSRKIIVLCIRWKYAIL